MRIHQGMLAVIACTSAPDAAPILKNIIYLHIYFKYNLGLTRNAIRISYIFIINSSRFPNTIQISYDVGICNEAKNGKHFAVGISIASS